VREERFFSTSNRSVPTFPPIWGTLPQHMTEQHMTEKTTTERRSRQRMPVRVPVKVRHEGGEHAGLTRDLSSSGIFLYSESGMKAGSKLELVIMLPPGLGLGPGGWTLCEASVVRVEESEGKGMGVAATIDRIDLLPEIS
jgi:PilZ domain